MDRPWQMKCAIDTVKWMLPFQARLRVLKDRVLGYHREPRKDTNTIRDGLTLIEWLGDVTGARVLEVGTGWQPMLPVMFSLVGATVYMTDLHRLLRRDTLRAALDAIHENRDEIAARLNIDVARVGHATRPFARLEERLEELRLTYLAPCDCRRLPFEPGSLDILMSRTVLEHVPSDVTRDIMREANRVLTANGVMLHKIDHSDHWSHRDRRITAVNFLQYSDQFFKWTCINPQNYQNRLRHSDYVDMLQPTGFSLKREQRFVDERSIQAVTSMQVAERFRRFTAEELATTGSILLAQRASGTTFSS
jgi:SAM-dependent methyltransferase